MEVLQRTANRGSIATGGYEIDNSLKIEADNSEVLERTYGSGGNVQKWTFSIWYKRTELTGGRIFGLQTGGNTFLQFASDKLRWYVGGNDQYTEAVYRDTSAWYHIVLQFDTTQATASNRTKIYVNGVQQTLTGSYVNQYTSSIINSTTTHGLGGNEFFNSEQVNGYMAEVYFVDGQALEPSDFGEYDDDSGIWKPKEYEGTYGTTGWYLDFEDAANLGDDVSGNNNDWTLNNITSADQATDTPTNNFCTFNPLMDQGNSPTISEGATKSTGGGGNWNQSWGSIGVKNGKWYYEFKVANASSTGYFGASTTPSVSDYTNTVQLMYNTSFMVGAAARIDYYYWQNGSQVSNESTGWGTISTNDVIGIALDLDSATKTFTVYKNGTALSGTLSQPVDLPTNMQDEFIFPLYVQYENRQDEANFGGYTTSTISSAASDANGYGTFEYAPPTGYYALCTKNLAEYG